MNVQICTDPISVVKTYAKWRDAIMSAIEDNGDGRTTEDTVIDAILRREWQILHTDKSVALANICVTPFSDVRIYYVHTAAGDLSDCLTAMDEIKIIAAQLGCHKVEVSGRKGWERALASRGFGFASLNLVADVSPAEEKDGR